MILSMNYVKQLSSLEKVLSSFLNKSRTWFSFNFLPDVRYQSLLPGLLSCECTFELLRVLRVTFSLFTVSAGREVRHWIIDTLPLVQGLCSHSMDVRRSRGYLEAIRGLEYSHSSLPYKDRAYLLPSPL